MIHNILIKHKDNTDVGFKITYSVDHEDHVQYKGKWYNLHYGFFVDKIDYICINKDKLKDWKNVVI